MILGGFLLILEPSGAANVCLQLDAGPDLFC